MYRNLLTGRNRGDVRSRVAVENQLINQKMGADYGLGKAYRSFTGGIGRVSDVIGEEITSGAESIMYDATTAWDQAKSSVGSVFEKASWCKSKHDNSSLSEEDRKYLIDLLKLPV